MAQQFFKLTSCQAYLESHPTLLPIASQYRCVKRMEQALLYLWSPNSCPNLRSIGLAMEPVKNLAELQSAFGYLIPNLQAQPTPFKTVASPLKKGLNQKRPDDTDEANDIEELADSSAALRRRQVAILVPVIKAFELDARHEPRAHSNMRLDHIPGSVLESEIVPPAAEGETHKQGIGRILDAGIELQKASMIVQGAARLWSLVPSLWRTESDAPFFKLASDIEVLLEQEDPEMYSVLILKNREMSFGKLIQIFIGDLFVGTADLQILCHVYDQMILCSDEATGGVSSPSIDLLLAWITASALLSLRSTLLQLSTTRQIREYLENPMNPPLSLVQASTLTSMMELKFVSKFRGQPAQSAAQPIVGYEGLSSGPLTEQLRRKVMQYRRSVHKGTIYEDEDLVSLSEEDLIEAEAEVSEMMKQWYVNEKERRRRKLRNMKRFRAIVRAVGVWALYLRHLGDDARVASIARTALKEEEERRRRIEEAHRQARLREEALRKAAQTLPTVQEEPPLGVWGDGDGEDDGGSEEFHPHSDTQSEIDFEFSKSKGDAAFQRLPTPQTSPQSLFLNPGITVFEETVGLSPFATVVRSIYDHVGYVLCGAQNINLVAIKQLTHAFAFERQLELDLLSVIGKEASTMGFRFQMERLPETKRERILKAIEKIRDKRRETELERSRASQRVVFPDEGVQPAVMIEARERAMAVVTAAFAPPAKSLRAAEILIETLKEVENALLGDESARDAQAAAARLAAKTFHDYERRAWHKVFGGRVPYSPEAALRLVSAGVLAEGLGEGAAERRAVDGAAGQQSAQTRSKGGAGGGGGGGARRADQRRAEKQKEKFLCALERMLEVAREVK